MGLKINSTEYAVGIASVTRSIRREEKYRVTTEDGVVHREVRATYMDFTLSVGNFGSAAYDSLMTALRTATDDITVELPGISGAVETYTGVFDGIADEVINDDGSEVLWNNLALNFTGTIPMEV
ncbi:MAG: hypothetical protein RRY65_04100 [Pseudoflavonifractor sp.]